MIEAILQTNLVNLHNLDRTLTIVEQTKPIEGTNDAVKLVDDARAIVVDDETRKMINGAAFGLYMELRSAGLQDVAEKIVDRHIPKVATVFQEALV